MDDLLIARVVAAGRVLFGTLCLVVPGVAFGPTGRDASPAVTFLIRLFGIRDVVLGAGALVSLNGEPPDARWVQFGAIADTADAVCSNRVPRGTRYGLHRRDARTRGAGSGARVEGSARPPIQLIAGGLLVSAT